MSPFILLVYLPAVRWWELPHRLLHNSRQKRAFVIRKLPKNRASSFYTQNPIPNQSHLRKSPLETPSVKDRKPVFYTLFSTSGKPQKCLFEAPNRRFGAGCRRFKSCHSDQLIQTLNAMRINLHGIKCLWVFPEAKRVDQTIDAKEGLRVTGRI